MTLTCMPDSFGGYPGRVGPEKWRRKLYAIHDLFRSTALSPAKVTFGFGGRGPCDVKPMVRNRYGKRQSRGALYGAIFFGRLAREKAGFLNMGED